MTRPTRSGPHWAKGPEGWKLLIVDTNQRNGQLVSRFADALHTEWGTTPKDIRPWFKPSPKVWKKWVFIHDPEWRVPPCVRERPNIPRKYK